MARTARFIVADYCYHVVNRSHKKARIFHESADHDQFLALMPRVQAKALGIEQSLMPFGRPRKTRSVPVC
jgi:hypothetical protein